MERKKVINFSNRFFSNLEQLGLDFNKAKQNCSAPRCQDTISKILSYIFLPSFVSF